METQDIYIDYDDMLLEGAEKNDFDLVKNSIENAINLELYGHEALLRSINNNNLELVKFLHKKGVKLHEYDNEALINSVVCDNIDITYYLLENTNYIKNLNELLLESVINGKLELVKLFIKQGAVVNSYNGDNLRFSIEDNKIEIFTFLIENGADINEYKDIIEFYCLLYGRIDIIKILLNKGFVFTKRNLKHVFINGYLDVIKLLFNYNKSIFKDIRCYLDMSAEYGHLEVVKFLIEKKMYNKTNIDNALINCISNENAEIVRYLLQYTSTIHNYIDEVINKCIVFNCKNILKLFINSQSIKNLELDTFLLYSIKNKSFDITNYLLNLKVDYDKDTLQAVLSSYKVFYNETLHILLNVFLRLENKKVKYVKYLEYYKIINPIKNEFAFLHKEKNLYPTIAILILKKKYFIPDFLSPTFLNVVDTL